MRALDTDDLRGIVHDPAELTKGAIVLDEGGLHNFARHGDRLYADAHGMMASPYKVMITIGDKVSARCTCMAARTRPFCKHAAGLLIAWSRAPESFAESDRPPAGAPDAGRKKRATRKGKRADADLMGEGIARVIALVRELAVTGIASVGEGRANALRALAEGLRAGKLRRLAGRIHRLADLIENASAGDATDGDAYAELLTDLLLTARKIEKHVAGEPLDPRHVEELIGKTWRKTDRAPIGDLSLVEIASRTETTPDGFVVREVRFLDLPTATHYAEKQIIPAFMARRTPARPSLAGRLGSGASGSLYPGYPPRRLDLETRGSLHDLTAAALSPLVAAALPGAAAALAAFQDHRKDVFAPDAVPVTVRFDFVVATGDRLRAVDSTGEALCLPADPALDDQLAAALRHARLLAITGDLVLLGALPVLVPLALITTTGLAGVTVHGTAGHETSRGAWHRGTAATRLSEVRTELGDLLAQGVGSLTERTIGPLVERLREIGLGKPAEVLAGVAGKAEGERLEDVIRVHQVLGIAVIRLVGTTRVERGELVSVPTCESVMVPAPERWLDLDEAARARVAGEIDRWTALAHAGRALEEVPAEQLLEEVHPWWSHAWLSPLVAARVAGEPGAVEKAREVLAEAARAGRTARQTAIRLLVAADPANAAKHVAQVLGRDGDVALGGFALELIDQARELAGDPDAAGARRERRLIASDLVRVLRNAASAQDRRRAAFGLGDLATEDAAAPLRQAWRTDKTQDVRDAAAISLGRRCDPDTIDTFVQILSRRDDDRAARSAALGLGQAGDVRGVAALVDAFAAGWKATLVGEALRAAGRVTLPALRAAVAASAPLGRRKAVKDLLGEAAP